MNPNQLRELIDGRVAAGRMRQRDADLTYEFLVEYSVLKKLGDRTILKWVYGLVGLFQLLYEHMKKSSDQLTDTDALTFISAVQHSEWAEDTRNTRWKQWTGYMRWMDEHHGPLSPKCQELFVKQGRKYSYKIDSNRVKRKDVPTRDETLRIVQTDPNPMWKAAFSVAAEGALSFIELSSLQYQDIESVPNGRGYNVRIREGKNAIRIRTVPLIEFSVAHVERWLKMHPSKKPESLLFFSPIGTRIQNATANKRLKKIIRLLDIEKHITMHCFRHARSTELCSILTEFEMNRMLGWAQGSKQPQRYIRTAAIDVRRKLMHGYGYAAKDEKGGIVGGNSCPRCGQFNSESATRCDICSAPMDVIEYRRMQIDAEANEKLVERLIKDKWKAEWENFREIVKSEDRPNDDEKKVSSD